MSFIIGQEGVSSKTKGGSYFSLGPRGEFPVTYLQGGGGSDLT
jgi:hypothetical protein